MKITQDNQEKSLTEALLFLEPNILINFPSPFDRKKPANPYPG